MMNISWFKHEIRLQLKNGLYGIYILVNLIYLFLLGYVPEEFKNLAVSIIIFTDPTLLGMVFIGAFILLEKVSGVIGGIAVSPLGAADYIKGKVFSMLIISLITSLVLAGAVKGTNFNIQGFIFVIVLSSILFTLAGIIIAVYTKTINQYLIVITILGAITGIPLLDYFRWIEFPILRIIPTYQVFVLIERTIAGRSIMGWHMVLLIGWLIVFGLAAISSVDQKLFRG